MTAQAKGQNKREEVSRGVLWFGQLGGPTAWLLHLTLAYAISEWGCDSRLAHVQLLGIAATAWLLLLLSAGLIGLAGFAAWTARGSERKLRREEDFRDKVEDARHPGIYIAHSGMITSGIFIFIIGIESIPTFFFLQHC